MGQDRVPDASSCRDTRTHPWAAKEEEELEKRKKLDLTWDTSCAPKFDNKVIWERR